MEENKDLIQDQNLEQVEEIDEVEAKKAEYELKLEEAMIDVEAKENQALCDPENEELLNTYHEAKKNYDNLLKEYKEYKKATKGETWWTKLPLRMKIFSGCSLVFAFPGFSWFLVPIWYYIYYGFYKIFDDSLKKMYSGPLKVFTYIYLGCMWYLTILGLIAGLVYVFIKRKKEDITENNKKLYNGFIIGTGACILAQLILEVVEMIIIWF